MKTKHMMGWAGKRSWWAAVLLGGWLPLSIHAQDLHFSQFFNTPMLRNPSLAGLFKGDVRVQGVYRDQWNSVTHAYHTGSFDAEFKNPVGRSEDFYTLGGQIMYDNSGSAGWTSTMVMPALNYHKSLSDSRNSFLSLGFMGGVVQNRIDPSKITTNSQYNGNGIGEPNLQPRFTYLDGSVGLSYNGSLDEKPDNNFYLGVAYHHFNHPKGSFFRNPSVQIQPKWVYSGGVRFAVSDYAYMTLLADHSVQGGFSETVLGGMYGLKLGEDPAHPDYQLHFGTFLRWNDAIIPVIRLDYHPYSITMSYDANISELKPSSYGRGGFELSITYTGFSNRHSTVDAMYCPRF